MLVVPALDLRAGAVVRLYGGDFARETAYAADPLEQARVYAAAGARRLHVVDLDAARGGSDNRATVERMVAGGGLEVQVAGGVRSLAAARAWLEAGAAAVVMGTAAVRRPDLLEEVAAALPGRVLAALDVRDGRPALTGWSAVEEMTVVEALERWAGARLGGVIVTSIDRDGTFAGPDLDLLGTALAATSHEVTYSGGIASVADLRALAAVGPAGVILGRSLLEGRIDLSEALALSA
ncbi:MAG: 1-(5-phosphoribosyl)-5-[(5-phosphoribosylamino)methylideneamino] imidazole-4-carboxamide isomerase [Candidatus Dormibacteraeota bacterium]|nr:1-(5-phosphoribosyl)-5-[(5-phosphoribosylamino)methylideneamino] imidazole-4-carboxamide isomerase [Candidatus Dormibacteraeota bacterium]